MDAAATVDAIHSQGGLAIAAHPYTNLMRWSGLVGVGDLIRELPFDAVETLEDLKGKRVNIGNPGSGQRGTMEVVMEALGWTKTSFDFI